MVLSVFLRNKQHGKFVAMSLAVSAMRQELGLSSDRPLRKEPPAELVAGLRAKGLRTFEILRVVLTLRRVGEAALWRVMAAENPRLERKCRRIMAAG